MTSPVKQSSTQLALLFFMTDSSDHVSGKTGLTPTVTISKNGASFASPSGAVSEIANGWYKVAGNATDTNTTGPIALHATGSGADTFDGVVGMVVGYDPTSAGLGISFPTNFLTLSIDGSGRVDVAKVAGTAQTARDLGASVLISSGTGTGQLDVTSGVIKANLAQILGTALTETAGLLAGGFKKFFNIATPASTMDALTLVATATNLTNAPTAGDFTATMKTSLNSATPAVTVSDKTGFSLSSAGVQAIWDKLTSALTTSGSIGKLLVDNITASISAVAAAVWDVTLASHLTSGTTGNALNAAGSAGDPWSTALPGAYGAGTAGKIVGTNLDAVVSAIKTKTDGLTFTVGGVIDSNVVDWKGSTAPANTGDAYARLGAPAGASISADVTAVKSDTGTILTDVNTGAGAIYSRLGAPAGASLAADIAAVPTANANADALLDRSAGVETSRTPRQAFRLILAALCGKASGLATTTAVYRDTNDSKSRITATVDSDGNRSSVTLDAS